MFSVVVNFPFLNVVLEHLSNPNSIWMSSLKPFMIVKRPVSSWSFFPNVFSHPSRIVES